MYLIVGCGIAYIAISIILPVVPVFDVFLKAGMF